MEEEAVEAKVNMAASFERYSLLKRELARVRTELTKALEWNFLPQDFTTLTRQDPNRRRGSMYYFQGRGLVVMYVEGKDDHLRYIVKGWDIREKYVLSRNKLEKDGKTFHSKKKKGDCPAGLRRS